jgi:hypothetical protein
MAQKKYKMTQKKYMRSLKMFNSVRKNLLLGLVLALFYSVSSSAALVQSSGYYLEGNVGFGTDGNAAGIVNTGYKFFDNFALEAGFGLMPNGYFDLAAVGIIPFTNGFEIFGKIGGALNDYNPAIFGGLGICYAFTSNFVGSVQGVIVSASSDDDEMYAATVGVSYIF